MSTVVTILHVFVCIILMLVVLLQPGKGGGMGAAFGGGGSSSGTVFGGAGATNFLRKLTVGSAVAFMLTSMLLAWIASTSGADALKRYSAQQRSAAAEKSEARMDALGGDTAPGEGEIVIPGMDESDSDEGLEPFESEDEGLLDLPEESGITPEPEAPLGSPEAEAPRSASERQETPRAAPERQEAPRAAPEPEAPSGEPTGETTPDSPE